MWALAQERMGEAGKSRQTLHSRNLSISKGVELSSFALFDTETTPGEIFPRFPLETLDDEVEEEDCGEYLGVWPRLDIFNTFEHKNESFERDVNCSKFSSRMRERGNWLLLL